MRINYKVLVADTVAIVIVFLLASMIRFGEIIFPPFSILLYCGSILIILTINLGLYDLFSIKKMSMIDILFKVGKAVTITFMIYATLAYFDWTFRLPRTIIMLLWVLSIPSLTALHTLFRSRITEKRNLILVGEPKKIKTFYNYLKEVADLNVLGYVRENAKKEIPIPWLGSIEQIEDTINKYKVDEVLICTDANKEVFQIMEATKATKVNLKISPDMTEFVLAGEIDTNGLGKLSLRAERTVNSVLKRLFDLFGSIVFTIILLPLMILVGLLVFITNGFPLLFKQKRQGFHGREFTLIKFRTMIRDAEKKTGAIISDNKSDNRITPIGRILRRTHLDELPQLFSIISGTMSFVGPRPEREELSKRFKKDIKEWDLRLYMKPGFTGLAQTEGISGLDPKNKIKRDLYYIKNQSLFLDIKIIIKTVWYVLFGHS